MLSNVSSETDKTCFTNRAETLLLVGLAVAWFAWLAWPSIWTASESSRLVWVFSWDESNYLRVVHNAIQQGALGIEWGEQGHFYANLVFVPLFLVNHLAPVSEQTIIVALRLTCVVFGAATVVATFLFARRYFGRFAAWLSALLVAFTVSEIIRMSLRADPDTLNMFLLVLSVYFCCRFAEEGRLKDLALTSSLAGLSFSTKYAGVLLLPLVGAVVVARTVVPPESDSSGIAADRFTPVARYLVGAGGVLGLFIAIAIKPEWVAQVTMVGAGRAYGDEWVQLWQIMRTAVMLLGCGFVMLAILDFIRPANVVLGYLVNILGKLILMVVTFGVAAFACTPLAFEGLLRGFFFEGAHTAFGSMFEADRNGLIWVSMLMGPTLINYTTFGLLIISLAATLYNVTQRKVRLLSAEVIIWGLIIIYFGFLIVQVNTRTPRYLLPIVPFVVILAAQAADQVLKYLSANRPRKPVLMPAIVIVVSFFFGLELLISLGRAYRYKQTIVHREQTHPAVSAGTWLAENYSPSDRVLYELYTYVPPSFSEAVILNQKSLRKLAEIDPDIVVVDQWGADIYSEIDAAKGYRWGEDAFRDAHDYYHSLAEGSAGYTLAHDFGRVKIYERKLTGSERQ